MTGVVIVSNNGCMGGEKEKEKEKEKQREKEREREREDQQISLLTLLLAAIRRSVVACRLDQESDDVAAMLPGMEIGWPTNVRHVAHVTFDRFNGFLGLPVEFELEVPCRAPSASASVFGVSPESMQCGFDSKGNSVPTILLLMQERLYAQGGLKAEGIFRINPENSQEEHVREQLNRGIVPQDIDVHCLAGLIKAWFRELPEGVLDGLSAEQVLESNTEEECVDLVKPLLPTQSALLNWAVELMADVAEQEHDNKMNARNIAMVFAPNMTQMSDPLTALMHAVQVMNLLKTLILKTLREREEAMNGTYSHSCSPCSSTDSYNSEQEEDIGNNSEQSENNYDKNSEQDDENSDSGAESTYRVYYTSYISASGDEEGDSSNEIEDYFFKKFEWKGDEETENRGEQETINLNLPSSSLELEAKIVDNCESAKANSR